MEAPINKGYYIIGIIILFATSYGQYLISSNFIMNLLIVYGVPILVASIFWGRTILKKSIHNMFVALKFGLGAYGAFTVLGTLISFGIIFFLASFDPSALNLLHRLNPVLNIPPGAAWVMVAGSFLIIGPSEEYIFRGFVYGGLLSIFKNRHWFSLAFISSIMFAAVHLYYGLTYGIASLIAFTDLITFGMAMAVTYYLSGGNLLIPALIHGAYDATGFLGVATSQGLGAILRYSLLLIGIIVALVIFVKRIRKRSESLRLIET